MGISRSYCLSDSSQLKTDTFPRRPPPPPVKDEHNLVLKLFQLLSDGGIAILDCHKIIIRHHHGELRQRIMEGFAEVKDGYHGRDYSLDDAAQKINGDILPIARVYVNKRNTSNKTPLHLSAEVGDTELVAALLKAGADVDAQDMTNSTPLHLSVLRGYTTVVELLIKAGAAVDAQDIIKRTPLHFSASKGYTYITDILVKAGANVNVEDIRQLTPLHLSKTNGHVEVNDILTKAGAYAKEMEEYGDWDDAIFMAKRNRLRMFKREYMSYSTTPQIRVKRLSDDEAIQSFHGPCMSSSEPFYNYTTKIRPPIQSSEFEVRKDKYKELTSTSRIESVFTLSVGRTSRHVPATTVAATTVPATTVPAITVQATTVPVTTVPATTVPTATVPGTTVSFTTVPATTVPATTVPTTKVPTTTVPAITVPTTTVPATTAPATTVPVSTVPDITVPTTTVPATTAPATTVPTTTVPATTMPTTTVPATTVSVTTMSASPESCSSSFASSDISGQSSRYLDTIKQQVENHWLKFSPKHRDGWETNCSHKVKAEYRNWTIVMSTTINVTNIRSNVEKPQSGSGLNTLHSTVKSVRGYIDIHKGTFIKDDDNGSDEDDANNATGK